jgi:hypothetical protein
MGFRKVLTGAVIVSLTFTLAGFSTDNSTLTEAKCKEDYSVCVKVCHKKYTPSEASNQTEKEDLEARLKGCLFRCTLEEKSCLTKVKAKKFFHETKEWFKGFLQR